MEDEIAELRKQLALSQRQTEEAERQTEEAERRAEEAERQQQKTTINEYLEDCFTLWKNVRVVKPPTTCSKQYITKPEGRLRPKLILPWGDDFVRRQKAVWDVIADVDSFASGRLFPQSNITLAQLQFLDPIENEKELSVVARNTVENAVRQLVNEAAKDVVLRRQLGICKDIRFSSHNDRGSTTDDNNMEETQIRQGTGAMQPGLDRDMNEDCEYSDSAAENVIRRPIRRGKGGLADQFCIRRLQNGQQNPFMAIEYKAPHKLTREIIAAGLTGEIRLEEDIINIHDDDSIEYWKKYIMAAVVTQCFSYMVYHGFRNGYIFTGEAVIFLHIPEDPTTVYYRLCLPSQDVPSKQLGGQGDGPIDESEENDTRLQLTAVAQIFAFVLSAMDPIETPNQAWHDRAHDELEEWKVEYIDILAKIPETERKTGQPPSQYKPGRWVKDFDRSPVQTRQRTTRRGGAAAAKCRSNEGTGDRGDDNDTDSHDESNDRRPDLKPPSSLSVPAAAAVPSRPTRQSVIRERRGGADGSSNAKKEAAAATPIMDQPYCTHACLLGLTQGAKLDRSCPNFAAHCRSSEGPPVLLGAPAPSRQERRQTRRHVEQRKFLELVLEQLATDRGSYPDCIPLHVRGARGALFKIRLSSYGYTFVAKGMEEHHHHHLRHEHRIYGHLSDLQAVHIPVCIGHLALRLPQYYSGGIYARMLLLSWAGESLSECIKSEDGQDLKDRAEEILREVHRRHIMHEDAEARNLVYDEDTDNLMLVDFERATFWGPEYIKREPLTEISSPNKSNKRKLSQKDATGSQKKVRFAAVAGGAAAKDPSYAPEIARIRRSISCLLK